MIELKNVHKRFGNNEVLRGIDLTVHEGEVVAIIGSSGSGKSTMLRTINHLETIDSGEILIDGMRMGGSAKEISRARAPLGMVFQQFNLFPHMTVHDNIALAPRINRISNKAVLEKEIDELLEKVGLLDKKNAYPPQLSGGQQQRIAIARALAMKPKYMLFDEPTSALDPELIGEVLKVIRQLADDGMTMMIVTHEMSFARDIADRIIMLDGGVIIEEGPPEQFFTHPKQERTRVFLRSIIDREKATQEKLLNAADKLADFINDSEGGEADADD
jgi:polar amino acid transport system ATP-binding protein